MLKNEENQFFNPNIAAKFKKNMRKVILSIAIGFASFAVISCGENADAENEFESTLNQIEQNTTEPAELNALSEQNGEAQSPSIQLEPTVNTPAANSSSAKLNPEHGAPGHDCAIPVGAPLDGSGGSRAPQALPNQAPAINPTPIVPTNPGTSASGKLNPAHGEPGHDCAVPVGAPLK